MRPIFSAFVFLALSFSIQAGYSLTVITQGSGYVSSSPSGILCGAACIETYDSGTSITLTATAQGGGFQSWSGACSGSQTTCTINLDGPKVITATFAGQTNSEYELTVYKSGGGQGTVSSNPYGISLGQIAPYDSAKFSAGSSVTLTASVQNGSRFDGWSGACNATQTTCTVKMDAAQSATATFSKTGSPTPSATPSPTPSKPTATPIPTPTGTMTPTTNPTAAPTPKPTAAPDVTLSITKSGQGRGALYIWPSGRSQQLCGSTEKECALTYAFNTSFTFQAVPVPDSQFKGWTGACNGMDCQLVLDENKKLVAEFEPTPTQKESQESEINTPSVNSPFVEPTPLPTPPYIPRATPTPRPPAQGNFPLVVQISGKGGVRSPDYRINCGQSCEAKFARYSQVPLTAIVAEGWKFVGWGGECRNAEGPDCMASIEGSSFSVPTAYVRAVFEPGLQTLSVSVSGPGSVTSSDYGIGPYNNAGQYKTDSRVNLKAVPEKDATFERWEGECNHEYPGCSVTMTGPKAVKAIFKGPPAPKKLNMVYPKESGASFKISAFGTGTQLTLIKECSSNCSVEFKHGTKIEIITSFTAGYVFEGFGGSCLGDFANCYLDMYSDKTVTVSLSKSTFKKLTVVKPQQGTVVSLYDNKIRCGSGDDTCVADFDNRSRVVLKFDGDYGVFQSGCEAIWKRIDQYSRPYEECVMDMKQDRTVTTRLSPEQEKWIVGFAMAEAFDIPDYPGLKAFATRENDPPFQFALGSFRLGKAGKTSQDVKTWIKNNWDVFLQDSGIGKYMQDYDMRIVRSALYQTFSADITAYKNKPWFNAEATYNYIYDPGQRPFSRALREWFSMHKGGEQAFEKHVKDTKGSYYLYEGIETYFREPPKATPTPKPVASSIPVLFTVRADDDQIGKPVTLEGGSLLDVRKVLIDGVPVESNVIDDTHIYLPKVRWGIIPDFGSGSTITFQTDQGIFPHVTDGSYIFRTPLNAAGKKEQCFGAIGKGCGGLFGKGQDGEATNAGKRTGCEALRDGVRACYISAGSIRHDNCCVWNPSGKWCGGPGTDGKPAEESNHNGKCDAEWHESVWDSFWERTWSQDFSLRTDPNLSPYPSPHKRYFSYESEASTRLCAPAGTELRESKDAPFCCSGQLDSSKKCR